MRQIPHVVRYSILLYAIGQTAAVEGFVGGDSWTTRDKAEHVAAGAIVSSLAEAFMRTACPTVTPMRRALVCVGAAVVAGTLKEAYDYRHPATHDCSAKDWTATAVGGILSTVAIEWTIHF